MKISEKRLRKLVREEVPNCVPDDELPDDYEPPEDDPCWDGYSPVGMKSESPKNGPEHVLRNYIRKEARRLSESADVDRIVQATYELFEQNGLNPRIRQRNVVEFGSGYDYVRIDQHDQHFFDVKISLPGMTKTHRISVRDSETARDAAIEIYDKLSKYGV
jgi:hypothetical protein